MRGPVLVVAAHPDDDVLGCGGTIAKMVDHGVTVHVAFLADGVCSRHLDPATVSHQIAARRAAATKACGILGAMSVSFGDFVDNRMDTIALLDIAQAVERLIHQNKSATVFTHHAGDVNVDHRRTLEAVTVACRPQPGQSVRSVLSFEVPSSTEWQLLGQGPVFTPNWFVDISATLDRKLAAIDAYSMELREWPHPRSRRGIEHLARWRGASMGADAAEAFVLGRQLL